ncbi:MAG: hypothetical protein E7160_03945 [Firmicutes bacterium]|nr:hypothetical protein [Bacillota bacterium]
MRIKKSFFNAVSNSSILIVRSILLFVVRIVFVKTLGKSLLGLDSLLTNLLVVLSITDLGISTAINYSLYKPIHDKDYKKVSALMSFYKKMYNFLGIIVLIIGIAFIPFLKFIVTDNIPNLEFIYILYLLTTASTYFISYKDSLLYADQKNYELTFIIGVTYILIYIIRLISLIIYPDFILFIMIQLVGLVLQRILINRYITKKYDKIDFNSKIEISKTEQKEIKKSVTSMFLYKVGGYLISGTDSAVISANSNLGVAVVGIYINYLSITSMMDSIVYRAFGGMTASYGDLAVESDTDVLENVYNITALFAFIVYGIITIEFWFLLTPFIKFCFGADFGLSMPIISVICANFYLNGILRTLEIIKDATGLYNNDKYATLIQTVINLALSIILCKYFGLIGVVLGTLISIILVPLWNKPYIIYKHIFKKNMFGFIKDQCKYLLVLLLIFCICLFIINFIPIANQFISFIVYGSIIMVISLLIIYIFFRNNEQFKYLLDQFINGFNKILKRA